MGEIAQAYAIRTETFTTISGTIIVPDNIGYTPGTGATVAADDIGGVLYQRIKPTYGADGSATDVSESNGLPVQAVGELIEAVEAMRIAVASLVKTIGVALPNASGQPIMEVRQPTAANLNATVTGSLSTVTTVSTVSTVTNQSQMGTYSTADYMGALYHLQADNLRRNIAVT